MVCEKTSARRDNITRAIGLTINGKQKELQTKGAYQYKKMKSKEKAASNSVPKRTAKPVFTESKTIKVINKSE